MTETVTVTPLCVNSISKVNAVYGPSHITSIQSLPMQVPSGLASLICQLCHKHGQMKLYTISRTINTLNRENAINKVVKARGNIVVGEKLFYRIKNHGWHHTIDFSRAQLAGINAARRTSKLFPSLGHNNKLDTVGIKAVLDEKNKTVVITSMVKCSTNNDVDTEAMTAVAIAALTIYDMGKKLNQNVYIKDIELLHGNEINRDDVKVRDHDNTPNNKYTAK